MTDQGLSLCAMPDGGALLAGYASTGFQDSLGTPTVGQDMFATRFGTTGTRLWSRVIGGSSTELAQSVALDDAGRVVLVGATNSSNFPVTWDACDQSYAGGGSPGDGVVVVLDSVSGALAHATYFGGNGYDDLRAAVVEAPCRVTLAGVGNSTNLTSSLNAFGSAARGLDDALVVSIDLPAAASVAQVAQACGPWAPSLTSERPILGTAPLLTATGAPFSDGLLAASAVPIGAPLTLNGCQTALDAASVVVLLPLWVDGLGNWAFPLPLPATAELAGLRVRLQVALIDPMAPAGFTTSNGLELRLGN